ncbi:pantoate--beta-alanine ligase [Parvularcula sp. ZS-1/3]|uniref:Pantothenate synthetase n=1 Tax=Parvularcula mediterranea TaxID=2732508 RepID=A0A7Y3RJY1_9PROT|nr:pantoate--beta-alanine ligase [Parvularcula mediterranea]NNU15464.1 pantoate--beta-alanine ligase [Parvularcula mediterranea]
MQVARGRAELDKILSSQKFHGRSRGFVPTMGALHDGHLSLVHVAKAHAERVCASLFINPKQFGPTEDLANYPRTEEDDLAKFEAAGVDLVYIPSAEGMYPEGYATLVDVGPVARPLDGASRPAFFGGIATVVTKLFMRVKPDVAVFGEKDYQQLLVIRRLVQDLDLGVKIVGAPIIREDDGLAMSSRNRYLTPPERRIAGELNQIMRKVCERIRGSVPVEAALIQGMQEMDQVGLRPVDYFELRSSDDLAPMPDRVLRKDEIATARLFAAVMLGRTRLIDNMAVAV